MFSSYKIPREIQFIFEVAKEIGHDQIWVAGGAARDMYYKKKISGDIDIFFGSEEILRKFDDRLGKSFTRQYTSKNAVSFSAMGTKIQLICNQYYESITAVFNNFDFTCCQFAYDGSRFHYTSAALNHAPKNYLEFALADINRQRISQTLARIEKYKTIKGFTNLSPTICDFIIKHKENTTETPNHKFALEFCKEHGIEVSVGYEKFASYPDSPWILCFKSLDDLNYYKLLTDSACTNTDWALQF